MFFAAFLIALSIALLFTFVLGFGFRRKSPGVGFLPMFLLIFLFVWAAGAWVAPVGPAAWDVPWLAFGIIGLIVTLLLATLIPPRPVRTAVQMKTSEQEQEEKAESVALGLAFWVLLAGLAVAIVLAYV
jgi:hypothetical protein